MATPLIGNIALVEGEDVRVRVEGAAEFSALIYRAYGMFSSEPPAVAPEVRPSLDLYDELGDLDEKGIGMDLYDGMSEGLVYWPEIARAGSVREGEHRIVLKVIGPAPIPLAALPIAAELESDMPDGRPAVWAGTIWTAFVRPRRTGPGLETLLGVRWRPEAVRWPGAT